MAKKKREKDMAIGLAHGRSFPGFEQEQGFEMMELVGLAQESETAQPYRHL